MVKERKGNDRSAEVRQALEGYEEPSLNWLAEKLPNSMLGGLKSSEMEIYLAYMLMYQRDELNKDSFVLADEYRMPETKIRRLQVEFARRFYRKDENWLKEIADGIFSNDAEDRIVLELSADRKKISFSVKNAAWVHSLKQKLAEEGLNWRDERNPRTITLDTYVFAFVFKDASGKLRSALEKMFEEDDSIDEIKKSHASFRDLSLRASVNWLKEHSGAIADIIGTVSSVVGVATSFMS